MITQLSELYSKETIYKERREPIIGCGRLNRGPVGPRAF